MACNEKYWSKKDLITKILEKAENKFSKKDTEILFDAVIATLKDGFKSGNKIQIKGFGNFEIRERAARQGKNPQNGEVIQIPACKSPCFKASSALKKEVNS